MLNNNFLKNRNSDIELMMRFHSKYLVVFCALFAMGCSTTYYATWEKLGKHKRDLLRDNVEEVRDEQTDAQEQFKDALTRLKELQNFDGGELEDTYESLNDEYEECVGRAEDVSDRIEDIDTIANDLFGEWEKEIGLISNPSFKSDSKRKLRATREKYSTFRTAMTRSEKRMQAVLVKFRDHVLYLKHNLNAQTVGALDGEVINIEKDVKRLITDMQSSISEADAFIKTL